MDQCIRMAQCLAHLLLDPEDARSNPACGGHACKDDLWWTQSLATVRAQVMPPNGGSCMMVAPHNGGQSGG